MVVSSDAYDARSTTLTLFERGFVSGPLNVVVRATVRDGPQPDDVVGFMVGQDVGGTCHSERFRTQVSAPKVSAGKVRFIRHLPRCM